MLELPNVTLVCLENRSDEKAQALMEAMRSIILFGAIVWKHDHTDYQGFREAEFTAHHGVSTSHYLSIHADGFVVNPECWRPQWLDYDYIGAPWPIDWTHTRYRVGNSGFSLRSVKLNARVEQLGNHPMNNDELVCQNYREQLETECFKFAPVNDAAAFSVESPVEETPAKTFGFHGYWPCTPPPPSYYILSHNMQ
jgi:hypothetical protein